MFIICALFDDAVSFGPSLIEKTIQIFLTLRVRHEEEKIEQSLSMSCATSYYLYMFVSPFLSILHSTFEQQLVR